MLEFPVVVMHLMFTREAITTPWVDGLESENTEANSLEKPLTIIRPRTHVIHVEQGTNGEFPKARQMSWAQQSCSLRIFRLKLDGSGKTGDERRESSGAIMCSYDLSRKARNK